MIFKYGNNDVTAVYYGSTLISQTYYGSRVLTLDPTFNPNLNNVVQTIAVDSSDKIYVGGYFTTIGGSSISGNGLGILSSNGTVVPSPIISTAGIPVMAITIDSANNVYFGGNFTNITFNGSGYVRNRIAKFNNTIISSFAPNINGFVYALGTDNANNVYVGGQFSQVDSVNINRFVRFNSSGNRTSANITDITNNINTITVDKSAGIAYLGTVYTSGVGNASISKITTGNVYTNINSTFTNNINTIAFDSTNLRVGGLFTSPANYAAILDTTGNIITPPTITTNNAVLAIATDYLNNLYMGGNFTSITIDGITTSCNRLVRIKSDGTLDTQFNSNITNGAVYAIAFDSSNNVYVGGSFTTINGVTYNRIARYLYS